MIGERLRVARARAKLTLRALAEKCGCTPQAVKKWEDEKAMPDSGRFIALCAALDVSAEWLFDVTPLDFHSTDVAPQGRHARYWVREAIAELRKCGDWPPEAQLAEARADAERCRAVLRSMDDTIVARSELFVSDQECLYNLRDRIRLAINERKEP